MKKKNLVYNIKDIEAIHRGRNSTFWITIKENDSFKRKRIAKSYFMELKKTILVTELVPMTKPKIKGYKTYNIKNIESIQEGSNSTFWVIIKENNSLKRKRIAKSYFMELKKTISVTELVPMTKPKIKGYKTYNNIKNIESIHWGPNNEFWSTIKENGDFKQKEISEEYYFELKNKGVPTKPRRYRYSLGSIFSVNKGPNSDFWITIKENGDARFKSEQISEKYFFELRDKLGIEEGPLKKLKNKNYFTPSYYATFNIMSIHEGPNRDFWITIKEKGVFKRKEISEEYFFELKNQKDSQGESLYEIHPSYGKEKSISRLSRIYPRGGKYWKYTIDSRRIGDFGFEEEIPRAYFDELLASNKFFFKKAYKDGQPTWWRKTRYTSQL